jgi:hypothetical protein
MRAPAELEDALGAAAAELEDEVLAAAAAPDASLLRACIRARHCKID